MSRGHVVLIGMMGVGKTTVGRLVAEALGRPFRDSDALIEERTGETVAQIFAERGEAAFRAEETAALEEMLAAPPSVVAAAGGAILDVGNRDRLRAGGRVIWLVAEPSVLAQRVVTGDHRPLLEEDPAGTLARLAGEREPLYRDVADHVVNTQGRTPVEVADAVVALVGAEE